MFIFMKNQSRTIINIVCMECEYPVAHHAHNKFSLQNRLSALPFTIEAFYPKIVSCKRQ